MERLDLLQQIVGQALPGDDREPGNVVDRLLRIELGALAAGARQNVDEMRADVEQAQFEHGEQAGRAGADDDDVGFDHLAHCLFLHPLTGSPRRLASAGIVAIGNTGGRCSHAFGAMLIAFIAEAQLSNNAAGRNPRAGRASTLLSRRAHDEAVQLGLTVIWQHSREFGCTSKAKSSMSSSICERASGLLDPSSST